MNKTDSHFVKNKSPIVTRRSVLQGSVTALIAGAFAGRLPAAYATPEELEKVLGDFVGNASVETGRITLKLPDIAENGNIVPVSVSVDSPMLDEDYVETVIILAEENPNPEVIRFHFTPANGTAEVATRMRLAKTQKVVAVAKMNDGSLFTDSKFIKVTIGGCGG